MVNMIFLLDFVGNHILHQQVLRDGEDEVTPSRLIIGKVGSYLFCEVSSFLGNFGPYSFAKFSCMHVCEELEPQFVY